MNPIFLFSHRTTPGMNRCRFLFLSLAIALLPTSQRIIAAIVSYDITGWQPAVPLGSTTPNMPLRYQLNVPDTNNATKVSSVPVDVQVEKWPKAGMPNETLEAAKLRKANAIKDAINAEFTRLRLPQMAEVEEVALQVIVGTRVRTDLLGRPILWRGQPILDPIIEMRNIGNLKIKGLAYDRAEADRSKRVPALTLKDPTGQPGGGVLGQPGRPMPAMPMPSPGSMSGKGFSATGMDFNAGPSEVSFGYYRSASEYWVATVRPQIGQSDSSVLMDLADLLEEIWQVPTSYETASNTLTLDKVLGPKDIFAFGSTDTGFDFEYAFPAAIPEPATILLLAFGGSALMLLRRPMI